LAKSFSFKGFFVLYSLFITILLFQSTTMEVFSNTIIDIYYLLTVVIYFKIIDINTLLRDNLRNIAFLI